MSSRAPLFIEFFGEEIPARMQRKASEDLKVLMQEALKALGLGFGSVSTFCTPRRLCIHVESLDTHQPPSIQERKGPRVDAPDPALQGFLRSVGLSGLDQCEVRFSGSQKVYYAVRHQEGLPTERLIPGVVETLLKTLVWPKSMRWGHSEKTWVRPLHGGLCLLGSQALSFSFAFGGDSALEFSASTQGHRFMAPETFPVHSFQDYQEGLRKRFVLLDPEDRRRHLWEQAQQLAATKGLSVVPDEKLIQEICGLVEWPVVLMGRMEERFMALPAEVLMTVMKNHQRYLSLKTPEGTLAPFFLVVSNIKPKEGDFSIVEGNQRVLKARFSDAMFFYNLDRQKSLESHGENLKSLIFHTTLGTLEEKTHRLKALSTFLAPFFQVSPAQASRAAQLAKADLVTEMVGEFPELQGVMGRYYAQEEGPAIAQAIAEHYAPRGPEDPLPASSLGWVVALADRIDTLTGFFGIGIKPTGSKDPYALRRAALGIIRLMERPGHDLTLAQAFSHALSLYGQNLKFPTQEILKDLEIFMTERLKVYWKNQGLGEAPLKSMLRDTFQKPLGILKKRIESLETFLNQPLGLILLEAYKRAFQILRIEQDKESDPYEGTVDESLLKVPEEALLWKTLLKVKDALPPLLCQEDFSDVFQNLLQLKVPLDAFFEAVTINDQDASLRRNRLDLLVCLINTVNQVADFSKIQGS